MAESFKRLSSRSSLTLEEKAGVRGNRLHVLPDRSTTRILLAAVAEFSGLVKRVEESHDDSSYISSRKAAMNGEAILNRIEVVEGDITKEAVDAIVNAANTTLLGGGGVDGAIHRGAGPELLEECRKLGGCATGQAKITKGYRLPAKWVIHTVGPVWRDGQHDEDELLASCYRSCLALAEENGIRTIAFPSISTGAYGFPIERAARIAVRETKKFLEGNASVERVLLVCFGKGARTIYSQSLAEATL
jgi:O-acetyl-ADP-ribose deacetylase (regulator of RNase III)